MSEEIGAIHFKADTTDLERAQKQLEKLGQTGPGVEAAAKKIGESIGSIGDGGQQAAQKVDGASRSIIDSIKKTTAASEAGEKSVGKFYEVLGKPANIGGDVLSPYLDQLKKADTAQNAAVQSLGKIGMSAKATEAALRGVPAQFTDIVVSLQGGMNPMTVFLQQGGQLKDMFGGAGAAAKALAGYVWGLVNPLTVAAAGAAALGVAYYQGSKESDAFVRSIVLTGNASGVTSSQLRDYARQIDAVVGTQAQAASGLADFVAAGVRGGEELRRYTQTAIEWEKLTGQAVSKTADQFASLQKDPLAAVIKLNEGTNFLTVSVYEQIKALDDQGRKADASKVAMEALDGAMRERGASIRESLGYIERGWAAIKGKAAEAWDAMLNVGRAATLNDQINAAQAELERKLTEPLAVDNAAMRASREKGIEILRKEIWALYEKADAEKIAAMQQQESSRVMAARLAFDKDYAKALENEATLQEKLAKIRREGEDAGKSEAEIKRVLAYETEQYNKAHKGSAAAAREAKKELSDQAKVYAELAGLSSTYYEELARGQKEFEKGNITQAQYVKYVEDLIKKQPFAIALAKEEEKARRDLQKAIEDDIKQADRLADKRQAAIKSAEDAVRKARQEEEAHALAAAANITLAEAVERLTIARLEDQLQMARMGTESQATIDALERELAARKELLGVLQQKGFREGNKKAADEAAKDWDKTAQTISRTLSDYIMSGGKDAAQYLKRLFATLVLEPIVQYGVNSLLGGGSSGGAGGSSMGGGIPGLGLLGNSGLFAGTNFGAGLMGGMPAFQGGIEMMFGGELFAGGMQAFGAALPWAGAALALISLIKSFDKSGTPHYGADAVYSGGETTAVKRREDGALGYYEGAKYWNQGAQDFVNGVAKSVGGMLDSFAKSFGRETGYIVKTGFADDSSKDGAWGALQIVGPDGKTIVDWSKDQNNKWAPREFADGEAGQKQYLDMIAKDVAAAMSKTLGDADWATKALESVKDLDSLNAVLQQIGAVKAAFDGWAKTLTGFADITGKAQTELLKFAGGIEALTNNINAFYAGFYSEAERAEILQRQVREQLKGLGMDIDPAGGEAAKKAFRKLIEDALASGNTELAAKLLALAQLFGVAADAAQKSAEVAADAAKKAADEAQAAAEEMARVLAEERQKAKDAAMANFEAAVAREQEYWQRIVSDSQAAVQAISSILTPLKQSAKELFGSIDAAQQMQAAAGMVYIEQALAGVRGGAKLSSFDGLTDAITAARGGITSGRYASQFERDRDALVLANQLSQIAGYGDAQLSTEERQLKASQEQLKRLDKTLSYWRDLLDDSKTQIDATLSVEAAIKNLEALMFPKTPAGTGSKPGRGSGAGAVAGPSGDESAFVGFKVDLEKGEIRYADGSGHTMSPEELHYYELLRKSGQLRDDNIASFDVGTNRLPRDMLAMVHKDEAIVPAAFNPWAGGIGMSGGNNNARLEALVAQLIDENRTQAGLIVRLQSQVAKMLQRWDGDGMPQPRKEGEGVAA